MTDHRQGSLAETPAPNVLLLLLRAVILVAAGTALLTLSAKFKVPFWPVPMTLQTLAVLLIAAAYGWKLGVATVLAYIAEGIYGLPVFTNTPPAVAGPLYLLGPTAGFIMSWVLVAGIVGYAADRGWARNPLRLGAAMLVAVIVQFAIGFAWLAWFANMASGATGIGMSAAFAGGVLPFLLGDAIKVALAALLVPAAWRVVDAMR